jgi:arabinoxylan arabinofuranohydrolase
MKGQAYNPFLPLDVYIPDGEPHIFGDRIYLFGSHDKEGGDTFCELDYEFFSAPLDDLNNWSSKGINYSARQDALYSEKRPYLYAPDVVRGNDGKYYLYYCLAGNKGDGGYHGTISVAVCDTPDGKYEYLGYVKNQDGTEFNKFVCFDPAVMNDNGAIRLYYGTAMPRGMYLPKVCRKLAAPVFEKIYGKSKKEILAEPGVWGANMITLCDDMLTVKSDAVRIIPEKTRGTNFKGHGFFEGSSIRKIKDTYYFIYSSQKNHELCYATSKYPDRDFTYGGTIVSNGDVGYNGRKEKDRLNATGTAHGSIENINGQWYVFYHRLTHGSDYSRQACAEPIQIEPDGSIHQVEISSCGLNGEPLKAEGEYPSVIACNITNGKMPHLSNRKSKKPIPVVTHRGNERFISNIDSKTTITYKWFDFIKADGEICFDIDSGSQGEMIVTADDEVIARVPINNFGRTTVSAKYHIQDLRRKSLSLKFSGKGSFNLYSFTFK